MKWTIHKTEKPPFIIVITEGVIPNYENIKNLLDIVNKFEGQTLHIYENRNITFNSTAAGLFHYKLCAIIGQSQTQTIF